MITVAYLPDVYRVLLVESIVLGLGLGALARAMVIAARVLRVRR